MIVDHERAWLELKVYLASKNSHGQRDLLAQMGKIEVACRVPEGERGFDPEPLTQRQSSTRALREVTRHG
jgi:hypothetical protein